MTESAPDNTVNPPPHVLLTLGKAGLYPPVPEGVGVGLGAPKGPPDGAPLLAPGKPLALLTFLALSPGRTASREFLLDLLWADMDSDRGRHALRQTIWQLRQLLGEAAFHGREEIRLTLPIDSDRDRFLAAVEAGDLDDAVARYTGPFLPAFAAPGGAEFEHWADRERDHLRGLFIRAADTLARRHLVRAQSRQAVKLARRIREAEPLHEGGWRLLLEALVAANDRIQAMVEADALEELLRVEGRDPEPATRTALRTARQIPQAADPGDGTTTLVAELVGREKEFSRLTQAWEQSRLGPSTQILITAPAGLGKSRLLHDFHARLRTLGARTVLVRANPGERDLPYALAADLAGTLGELPGASAVPPAAAAALVALNPALSARFPSSALHADGTDQILQRTIALAELVNAVAYEAPIAILVDDLHWADPQSARVLHALQARVAAARALIVFASRHDRDRSAVQPHTIVLPLAALDRDAIEALLASLGRLPAGDDTEALAGTLARATGGSPLHLLDALHQAIENEHLALVNASWEIRDRPGLMREIERGGSIEGRLRALDQPAAWLLTLLAAAGAPCSADLLARAAAREGAATSAGLGLLEQRGFVSRAGTEWEPAHDEIAETALDIADDTTRRAAARALGEALAPTAGTDEMVLRRAMQLLLAGGAAERIAPLLAAERPELVRIGNRGERMAWIAEFLGREESDPEVITIASALPRPRRWPWLAAAAAVVVTVALAAVAMARSTKDSAQATLYFRLQTDAGVSEVRRVTVRPEEWSARASLPSSSTDITLPRMEQQFGASLLTVRGRNWQLLHSPSVDNIRTHEVARTDRNGTLYLTDSERDDGQPALSPDRRWIVFGTSRWSPRGEDHTDLAIMDSLGGSIRQLTGSPTVDASPRWDRSGTRIAFIRRYREIRASEICVVTIEGAGQGCHAMGDVELDLLAGWLDPRAVLVLASSPGRTILRRIDILTGESMDFHPALPWASVSPDGRWVACICPGLNGEPAEARIIASNNPSDARTVALPQGARTLDVAWNTPDLVESAIARIEIAELPRRLARDVSHLPELRGRDGRDRPATVPPGVARWWTTDTAVVAVDAATGRITPKRDGVATIHVTAGGWRDTSVMVEVAGVSFTPVLDERWEALDPERWRSFGDPVPYLARGPGGMRTMVPAGDGSYPSGAYSRQAWSAEEGLGVEAMMSVPVNRTIWQNLGLDLQRIDAMHNLGEWDHRTGGPLSRGDAGTARCGAVVPAGEGATWLEHISLGAGSRYHSRPMPLPYRDGAWFRLRIQLFPDGSCGYAINGIPLARSDRNSGLDHPFRLWISGHAVGSTPMFGSLEVWMGVKPGVDWGALDR